jgi:hypothetical protein
MNNADYAELCAMAAALRQILNARRNIVVDESMDVLEELKHVPRRTAPRVKTRFYGNEWREITRVWIEPGFTPRVRTRRVEY